MSHEGRRERLWRDRSPVAARPHGIRDQVTAEAVAPAVAGRDGAPRGRGIQASSHLAANIRGRPRRRDADSATMARHRPLPADAAPGGLSPRSRRSVHVSRRPGGIDGRRTSSVACARRCGYRRNARQGRWLSGTGSQKTHSPPTYDCGRRVAANESTAPGEGRDSNQSPGSARGLDVWSGAAMSGARVCGHGASSRAGRTRRGAADCSVSWPPRIGEKASKPPGFVNGLPERDDPQWSPLTNSAAGRESAPPGLAGPRRQDSLACRRFAIAPLRNGTQLNQAIVRQLAGIASWGPVACA